MHPFGYHGITQVSLSSFCHFFKPNQGRVGRWESGEVGEGLTMAKVQTVGETCIKASHKYFYSFFLNYRMLSDWYRRTWERIRWQLPKCIYLNQSALKLLVCWIVTDNLCFFSGTIFGFIGGLFPLVVTNAFLTMRVNACKDDFYAYYCMLNFSCFLLALSLWIQQIHLRKILSFLPVFIINFLWSIAIELFKLHENLQRYICI